MRPDHIKRRVNQQCHQARLVALAYDNLVRVDFNNISPQRIQIRLDDLKEQWATFALNHKAIQLSLPLVESLDREHILQNAYFRDDLFAVTHDQYLDNLEKMSVLLSNHNTVGCLGSSVLNTPSLASQVSPLPFPAPSPSFSAHGPRLPRIALPSFNGSLADWLSFQNLFTSLVINNGALSAVEKLHYLQTSLTGSASDLLKNTPLTDDNFQRSWDALVSFYQNRRVLVNSTMQALFSIKKINRESADALQHLYTTVMQIYRSLETLERPVHTWGDVLVFIVVQRLDPDSVRAWELQLGSSKEPPSWDALKDFLRTRMLSLQAFERSQKQSVPQSQKRSVPIHFAQRSDPESLRSYNDALYPLCSARHSLGQCSIYLQKTCEERRNVVSRHQLCFNCLRRHRISMCRSTIRCITCGRRHHTSLHQIPSQPLKVNQPANNQSISIPTSGLNSQSNEQSL